MRTVPSEFGELRVHVRNIRMAADRMVYRAKSGGANAADVTRPTFVARPAGFLWARTNAGSGTGNRLVRYTLRGSKCAYAQGRPFFSSTAWAGSTLGAATVSSVGNGESQGPSLDPNTNHSSVAVTGPLQFNLSP